MNTRTPDGIATPVTPTRNSMGVYSFTWMWTEVYGHVVQLQGTAPCPFSQYQSFSVLLDAF